MAAIYRVLGVIPLDTPPNGPKHDTRSNGPKDGECQMHVGVASSSLGMVDAGTCYTVDAQRHVRGFTMFAWYVKCRRAQHC